MPLLVIECLGVEWVGDKKPALEQIGPLLVAGAAAFAAWLAAHTANTRQKSQLDHDSERQREQLEHDTARQREQLLHDREMRDREHLRAVLETVLKSLSSTIERIIVLSSSLQTLEEVTGELKEAPPDLASEAWDRKLEALNEMMENLDAVTSALTATVLDGVRLRLFLTPEDRIVKGYSDLVAALRHWRGTLKVRRKDGELQLRDEDELAETVEARKKSDELLVEFQKACHSRFAVDKADLVDVAFTHP